MSITSEYYGRTKDGRDVYRYTLENARGMRVCVIEYGCAVTHIFVPDKTGGLRDVVLGYENLAGYEAGTASLGALVGRYANRIEGAAFELDGRRYELEANDGPYHLHGCFGRKVFQGRTETLGDGAQRLVLKEESPAGEDGFPGNMEVGVAYTLTEDNALVMDYTAVTDEATLVNLTNHSYFNLEGYASGSVLEQRLTISAGRFLEANEQTCPTGRILGVEDTPFDFRAGKLIGAGLREEDDGGQLAMAHGYDHCFVLDKQPGQLALAAKAYAYKTGISMEVFTTQPGMQLYTANFLSQDGVDGKTGGPHADKQAFCLETQHYPCTPSHPEFPGVVLRPEEEYHETTIYRFGVE